MFSGPALGQFAAIAAHWAVGHHAGHAIASAIGGSDLLQAVRAPALIKTVLKRDAASPRVLFFGTSDAEAQFTP
jgi:hypothetical protein